MTDKHIERIVNSLKKPEKKEVTYSDIIATRNLIYHVFAREYGWTRATVDAMRYSEISFELKMINEERNAQTPKR